jgi:hypothetical protein
MKAALSLFAVVVLYRTLAADFGTAHLWVLNFSPLAALALCGPMVFPRRLALLLPLSILLVSDILLNIHFGAAFVSGEMLPRYLVLASIALLGLGLRARRKIGVFVAASMAGSCVFYLVTNTASWLTSPGYARTAAGWVQALTAGLPGYPPTWMFFRNSLVSDLCFTMAFLACLKVAERSKAAVENRIAAGAW